MQHIIEAIPIAIKTDCFMLLKIFMFGFLIYVSHVVEPVFI